MTPNLAGIAADLERASVPSLVLRGHPGDRDTAYAWDERTIDIMVAKADVETARRLIEPMSWRYAWTRKGLLRLLPMAYYWWDGGTHVAIRWGSTAAPLPGWALDGLTEDLWQESTLAPEGFREPAPAALLVHLAVQACRPGRGYEDDWRHFLKCRAWIDDWEAVHAIARHAGVGMALRRALAAAEADRDRPGPGPLFDGAKGLAWRAALVVQRRIRPRRLRRLLAGTPSLGEFTIRCRVAGVEIRAEPGVFVPTPDADIFVDMCAERIAGLATPTIVEVGTGCGAIALALANQAPAGEVHATELSGTAVRCARRNARRLRLDRVRFHRGSVLGPLPAHLRGRVDVIIANLPFYPSGGYASIGAVPRDTIQGSGDDGLDLVRQLARDAIPLLRPGGHLLLQMFERQWETMSGELVQLGYRPGNPRVSGPFAICPADLPGPASD